MSEIQEDRCGKSVQENVIHSVVHSFVLAEQYKKKNPLALYENMFEEKLLQDTGDYYRSGVRGGNGVKYVEIEQKSKKRRNQAGHMEHHESSTQLFTDI